jgi:hypothetical protein
MEKLIVTLIALFFVPLVLFVLYAMVVMLPMALYADMKCKEAGYPKAEVTVNMKMYCMNLDGSVTVKVDALK